MTEYTTNIKDEYAVTNVIYKAYLHALKEQGCSGEIRIDYNGYNDSGAFSNAEFTVPQTATISMQLGYEWGYARSSYIDSDGLQIETDDYKRCLMSYARHLLDHGWEIDDGSHGTIVLDVEKLSIEVEQQWNDD